MAGAVGRLGDGRAASAALFGRPAVVCLLAVPLAQLALLPA